MLRCITFLSSVGQPQSFYGVKLMWDTVPELEREQPDVINENRAEIERFQRKIAEDIVQKLLVLIALVLELPEDYLTNGHQYSDVSECHLRYMVSLSDRTSRVICLYKYGRFIGTGRLRKISHTTISIRRVIQILAA